MRDRYIRWNAAVGYRMMLAGLALFAVVWGAHSLASTAAGAPGLSAADDAEIHQLYARYSRALDLGDGPGRVATFTPDGTFSSAITKHVPEGMASVEKRTTERGNSGSRHLVLNIILTPTAAGADGFCYLVILNGVTNSEGALTGRTGFYVDKLVRTAQGWRFKSRETWGDYEPDSPFRPRTQPAQ